MRFLTRTLAPLTVLVSLAACASTSDDAAWAPRADASLAADQTACRTAANDLDIRSPKEFTDGRYGAAAAMASRIDQQSAAGGTVTRMREAVFDDCMTRKGWTRL